MKRYNIVHGDTTTAGGTVIAAQNSSINMGKNLAVIGDEISCFKCNTTGRIVPDGPRLTRIFMGREAALDRDVCMCDCVPKPRLVNSLDNMYQTMAVDAVLAQGFGSWVGYKEEAFNKTPASSDGGRIQFISSETNELLANRQYVAIVDGYRRQGVTDGNGYASIDSRSASDIQVHLVFEASRGPLTPQQI